MAVQKPLMQWSLSQTAELCRDGNMVEFVGRAPMLPINIISSVDTAVQMLNSGEARCDPGVCICHSKSQDTYFVLWRDNCKELAYEVFGLVDAAPGGRATPKKKHGLRFADTHRTFVSNFRLSVTTALWAVIFGIPMFAPDGLHNTVFGSRATLGDLLDADGQPLVPQGATVCGNEDIGRMVYDRELTVKANRMAFWNEDVHGPWDGELDHPYPQMWCGMLPRSYDGNWPNVVQMILFTAYFSTGTTVMQAWQGVFGTFMATANAALLSLLYPTGAMEVDGVLQDPNYNANVVYADFLVFVFLLLFLRMDISTLKFGLSWHMTYMMNFVNPSVGNAPGFFPFGFMPGQWDSYRTVVLLTSLWGALLAILATVFPFQLLNITKVQDDADTIVLSIDSIWTDAIDYFCGKAKSGKRLQIAAKLDALDALTAGVAAHLDKAWWETFDRGAGGHVRSFLRKFDEKVGSEDIRNLLRAVKGCVENEKFDEDHIRFCSVMRTPMQEVRIEVAGLLYLMTSLSKKDSIGDDVKKLLEWKADAVAEAQKRMLAAYQTSGKDGGNPRVSPTYGHEYTFAFALSYWAREMSRLSRHVATEQMPRPKSVIAVFMEQVFSVFNFSNDNAGILHPAHLNFALRNFISITLAFFLGIWLHQWKLPMYRAYSASMAGTLSLLISNVGGSAMDRNLKRLLGVVLGKVIPIIIIGWLDYHGCGNTSRFVLQSVATFLFIFSFEYVYFTSTNWGYIGGLIAAFGCYPLLAYPTCSSDISSFSSSYITNYEELCEIVTCIFLQMVVDHSVFEGRSATQKACHQINWVKESICDSLDSFFEGRSDARHQMQAMRAIAMTHLTRASSLAVEVDPSTVFAPGPATPFKFDLYLNAIDRLWLVLSDINMVISAIHEPHHDSAADPKVSDRAMMSFLGRLDSWRQASDSAPKGHDSAGLTMQQDVTRTAKMAADVLLLLLRHDVEGPVKDERLIQLERQPLIREVNGKDELYKEVSLKLPADSSTKAVAVADLFEVRIAVIVVALDNIIRHMGDIDRLCIAANIH